MEERIYDYWVATLQNGYIGKLVEITESAGGAKSLYEMCSPKNRADFGRVAQTGQHKHTIMLTDELRKYFFSKWKNPDELEKEYYKMMNDGIYYVNHTERDFPEKLRNIPSPPYGLFVKGSLPSEDAPSVAIVGARECSEYGRVCSEYFGDRLAREGVEVISGMAWGIDGISQMAAIQAGGKSFGVLGCGPDIIYPRKNARLYEMLCERGNGIISEYAPHTAAESRRFPPRNRIISGLCDVLLVIEARAKSGTLITVSMAMEQGKTVMALPGRITDELSRGCLMLINDGAIPAISIESVIEELKNPNAGFNRCGTKKTAYAEEMADAEEMKDTEGAVESFAVSGKKKREYEQLGFFEDDLNSSDFSGKSNKRMKPEGIDGKVYECLSLDPITAEDIGDRTGLAINAVLVSLSKLDMDGYAKEIAVGQFVRG